jgi:hypothetical protein
MPFHTVGSIGGKVGVDSLNIPGTGSRLSGVSVAMLAVGGILLWSGIRGATISNTLQAVFKGNPGAAQSTEGINISGGSAGTAKASNPGNVVSGSSNQNYVIIANYLVGNGYSKAAAAGICACIAGESSGNPESIQNHSDPGAGGEGLIQWTPGSAYKVPVTGNASADLQAQLPMIIAYNNAQGANYISMLNQISDPVAAADFYSQYFERPAISGSDVVPSVARSVYAEINKNDNVPTG